MKDKKDKWTRVKDKKLPGLWKRAYYASGERRERYYARFTCKLKGKPRNIALGFDLEAAKVEHAQILADNRNGKDFDAVRQPAQGWTFRAWAGDYFKNKLDPTRKAGGIEREKRSYKPLEAFFGDMLLGDIKRGVIMQYRAKRLQEPIVRRGKVVMVDGKPRVPLFLTINRELALLRSLLRLAEADEVIEAAPRFTGGKSGLIKSEKDHKRNRVCSADEFRLLCENLSRPALRILATLYYTAMRTNEAINLPWAFVDEKAGFIRLPASYVKENKPRNVPIVAELQSILDELKAEQRKVASIGGRVFTRNGRNMKSIRTAFRIAKTKAGIEDLRLHDFRHTAITRWAKMGIPSAVIMAAAGHHSAQQSQDYINIQPDDIKAAFSATYLSQAKALENANAASY